MITQTFTKIFGTKHDREMKRMRPMVERVNQLESKFSELRDSELQAKTGEFKERISRGESLDDILPEAFAACREASKRVLGMRHYDVQLIGGYVLNSGSIAEMKTGEGKTLVATLPIYLNALSGKGAHLVTVNDYLATRDNEWMGRMYNWMGLTTGTIVHDLSDAQRKAAYGADITYGTNNEFGFDFLRDNMKFDLDDYVQRELNFAIVDECDSILIDEARTPLIISGPKEDSTDKYYEVNKVIPFLEKEVHFTMEEKSKTASLTEEGNSKVEELLKVENIYDPIHIEFLHLVYQGLKAYHLYKKDVDYMIKNGEVMIVDEFTGRLMPGRRWSDGLHQAIEAKEGVEVKNENQTLATITFQNYFRMYNKLAGMTGTADTEAVEFKKIYNLDVHVIPTNRPIARVDRNDLVYKDEKAKYNAIAEDIKGRVESGQPVLVGTVSIEKSELISSALKSKGIVHNVLNAKHHEKEADIVSQAGRKGAITIATNMAGRGTDIVLGGNSEAMARSECGPDASDEIYQEALARSKRICDQEKEDVLKAGGLYIIGTERHESRRIDNQLRGRSGRQGDPGESLFYLSLEDSLMRIFNGERLQKIMTTLNVPDDEPIEAPMVSRAIEGAQRKVEGHNFDIRKHLLDYDDVMNQHRTSIYGLRRKVLRGENIERTILDMLGEVTSDLLDFYVHPMAKKETWDLDGLKQQILHQFGFEVELGHQAETTLDQITDKVSEDVKNAFDRQKVHLGEHYEQAARMILLQTIDVKWKEHLESIDQLKEGINLRAYAQKDPLIEYKKEAFVAFERLNQSVRVEFIEKLMKIQLVSEERARAMAEAQAAFNQESFEYAGGEEETQELSAMFGAEQERQNQGSQRYQLSRGGGDDGEPQLNREQRRRREKKKKKIKI